MADYQLTYTGAEVDTAVGYAKGLTSDAQEQLNTLDSEMDSHTQPASRVSAGTFAGKVVGNATAEATLADAQFRNITISSSAPTSSDGNNGDIWLQYDA